MVIADGEAAVATRTATAWPHVGQNAVAFEISLPHFEQYTESPFRANGQAERRLRESYFPPWRWSITRGTSCFQTRADHSSLGLRLLSIYTTTLNGSMRVAILAS
jgi:hypothetical protein